MGLSPGQVAQLVEQRIENPCVGGSIPPLATIDCVVFSESNGRAAAGVKLESLEP